jgi:hypothetical protein
LWPRGFRSCLGTLSVISMRCFRSLLMVWAVIRGRVTQLALSSSCESKVLPGWVLRTSLGALSCLVGAGCSVPSRDFFRSSFRDVTCARLIELLVGTGGFGVAVSALRRTRKEEGNCSPSVGTGDFGVTASVCHWNNARGRKLLLVGRLGVHNAQRR